MKPCDCDTSSARCAPPFSLNASAAIPASEQTVAVEFYHAQFDHYFISADAKEINDLDTGVHKGWTRTGYRFSVMKGGSSYAGTSPVCRFYSATLDTHFYSAKKSECDDRQGRQFGDVWTFESDEVFRAFVVDPATGVCGADTTRHVPPVQQPPGLEPPLHRPVGRVPVHEVRRTTSRRAMAAPRSRSPSARRPAATSCPCRAKPRRIARSPRPATRPRSARRSTSTPTAPTTRRATCGSAAPAASASCTSNKTAAGRGELHALRGQRVRAGPSGDPHGELGRRWRGAAAPVPICSLTANTLTPTVGQNVTLTATCNNSPSTYEWLLCSATIGNPGDPIGPAALQRQSHVRGDLADLRRVAIRRPVPRATRSTRRTAVGTGPKVYVDMAWTGNGGGGPPGGGGRPGVQHLVEQPGRRAWGRPSRSRPPARATRRPTTGSAKASSARAPRHRTCQATHNIAQTVTYGVSGINAAGQVGGRTYTGVNWTQTTPQPPACTLSASNMTPQVGQTITITSSCTNSPLTWTWTGCTSTTSSCTDAATAAGPKTYTLIGDQRRRQQPGCLDHGELAAPPDRAAGVHRDEQQQPTRTRARTSC